MRRSGPDYGQRNGAVRKGGCPHLCRSLVNPELVAESPVALKLDSWGMKLEEITSMIAENVRAGKVVVRLHSGDPAIYGSIVEQIAPLEEDGIHAEIVPSVSSMFGAAVAL